MEKEYEESKVRLKERYQARKGRYEERYKAEEKIKTETPTPPVEEEVKEELVQEEPVEERIEEEVKEEIKPEVHASEGEKIEERDLTNIEGIGATRAIKLGEKGIKTIENLAGALPVEIAAIAGVSIPSASAWIKKAAEISG